MEDLVSEILPDVKMLLGIGDETSDSLLIFLIRTVADDALAYCRLAFVPRQLYGVIARIAADIWRGENYGGSDYGEIKAVTEGDRRIEFDLSASGALSDYRERLKPYRNRAGRLPSELDREAAL